VVIVPDELRAPVAIQKEPIQKEPIQKEPIQKEQNEFAIDQMAT
jgi:hypothetical protein